MIVKNEVRLLKNNDNRNWEDMEWINEFYKFLQGQIPDGMSLGRGHTIKLSPNKANSIIWYLQEHFPLLPDHIEKCDICNELYDPYNSGYYSELTSKFYCDSCLPPFLDEKEEKIIQRRQRKLDKLKII